MGRVGVLLGVLVLIGACTGESSLKPCPPKGLGVESSDGVPCGTGSTYADCSDQLHNHEDYDCRAAQIVPNRGWLRLDDYIPAPNVPADLAVALTNGASVGDLVITRVTIHGDARCSFSYEEERDLERKAIPPGESAALRVRYRPETPGEDYAKIRIISNAQNYPSLDLPICGRALPRHVPGLDSGPPPAASSTFRCKEVGDTVAPCHK